MQIVQAVADVRREIAAARAERPRIGLVPTMGALHAGHVSLIERARQECGFVAVSIFVNPTQFGPGEDFERYPRPREEDLEKCRAAGVDLVWEPARETLYPGGFETCVEVERLATVLEGEFRPGHFRGVATVVLKLFNVVQPDVAYFGMKDYQQQLLIRRMCRDLDVPVEIVACPTVREEDGLALSSRNAYLSPSERETARVLSRSLFDVRERLESDEPDVAAVRNDFRRRLEGTPGVVADYATICDTETLEELDAPRASMVALVAARVGSTRLIDNVVIAPRRADA